MLRMADQRNPRGRWWIKADGCDILKGLRESTKRDKSGDVDMNDGVPQQHYHKYMSRLAKAATLKCNIPPPDTFYNKIIPKKADFKPDLSFLEFGNHIKPCLCKKCYLAIIHRPQTCRREVHCKNEYWVVQAKTLSELAWKVHEYKSLTRTS